MLDDLIEGDADDDSSDFVHNYLIMRRTVDHKGGGGRKRMVREMVLRRVLRLFIQNASSFVGKDDV